MTAQSKSYKIVAGPSDLDLAMALVARKLRLPLEITVEVEGVKIKLMITLQELAENGRDSWIMGGCIETLQRPGYKLRPELSEMLQDWQENGPFYRAFYSTQDRQGRLAFGTSRMIPYHSPIFAIPNFTPESNEKRLPEEWRSDIGYEIGDRYSGWSLGDVDDVHDTWNDPCTLAEFYRRLAKCEDVVIIDTGRT